MKKLSAVILICAVLAALCTAVSAEDKAVVYHTELDFSDISDKGSFTEYKGFGDDWKATQATQHETHGEGGTLHFAPFAELVCQHQLTGLYVFSSDVKSPGSQFFGIFVRSTGESLSSTPYFEHDGILTDSGDADNEGIGATGIYVIPRGTRILLCVKTADGTQAKGIGTDKTYLDTGVDMSGSFAKLTFEDDGKEVRILVADKLICTVKMSDPTTSDFMSAYKLYTRADICDAEGNAIKTVVNCRISADFSTVAYGMRINGANIDNVSITEYEKEPEETTAPRGVLRVTMKALPEKKEYLLGEELDLSDLYIEVTYDNYVKEDIKITPDMTEGFDNQTEGTKLIVVRYGKTSTFFSVRVVGEYGTGTEIGSNPYDAGTEPGAGTETESDPGNSVRHDLWLIIVGIVAAAAVCFVLVFFVIKGKRPDTDRL